MGCWGRLSRRTVLQSLAASLTASLGRALAGVTGAAIDPVQVALRGFSPTTVFQRRYRMDATILLLGAPLFTHQAAGGGYASVEISAGESAIAVALQFAAGSSPARAHGL